MTFEEYQKLASRTAGELEQGKDAYMCYALGLAGEAGEFANKIKKIYFHGHDFDQKELVLELSDVLWYLSMAAFVMGVPLEQVAIENIEKLKRRYPNGFTEEASRNRVE